MKECWHNRLHLEMNKGLINDPNGLAYFQGKYHVFFQWNPLECKHANKHWGHVTTTDFIHYSEPEIAVAPIHDFDKDGCYSGSARVINTGQLEIFYTANYKDELGQRFPRQISAISTDGSNFSDFRVIIDDIPSGYTEHYRDPFYFEKNNRHFLILGAQRSNLTGACVIYEELEGVWKFRGELQTNLQDFGYMWECPNIISIGKQDILVFCPQGLEATEYMYRNRYQVGYVIGEFNPDTLEFIHGEFRELDYGMDFYAPQILQKSADKKGSATEHILLGWVGMPDEQENYPTAQYQWLHSLTLAREISVVADKIIQYPAKSILEAFSSINTQVVSPSHNLFLDNDTNLRLNPNLEINNLAVLDNSSNAKELAVPLLVQGKFSSENWHGDIWKLVGPDICLKLYPSEEQDYLIFERLAGNTTDIRYLPLDNILEHELLVIIDNSIVEIYLDNGLAVATACYYA